MAKITIDEIRNTLVAIILKKSVTSQQEAEILADDYIEGELQGKKSHGLAAFPAVVSVLGNKRHTFEVIKKTESFFYIEAHEDFGAIVGRQIADILLKQAKIQGVAVAIIRNMKAWLRPAAVADYIAKQNCLGLVFNTGGPPMVAPPGGTEPVVGTNPIGIGIPSSDIPTVIDMATATRAWGEVRLAKRFNHILPPDSFQDATGQVTLDPEKAHAAIPMGGYKGFGLGLLIEILCGSLAGMKMGGGSTNKSYPSQTRGAAIIVINPDFTVGAEQFKQENKVFIDIIRHSPPAKHTKVTIPGDRAIQNRKANEKQGYLEIDDNLWKEILSYKDTKR
jgi:L-2-hydroxycarboxylate dehydrogenase (NAD+)